MVISFWSIILDLLVLVIAGLPGFAATRKGVLSYAMIFPAVAGASAMGLETYNFAGYYGVQFFVGLLVDLIVVLILYGVVVGISMLVYWVRSRRRPAKQAQQADAKENPPAEPAGNA